MCVCVCLSALFWHISYSTSFNGVTVEDVALEICETIKENQLIRTREEDENWYSPVTIK